MYGARIGTWRSVMSLHLNTDGFWTRSKWNGFWTPELSSIQGPTDRAEWWLDTMGSINHQWRWILRRLFLQLSLVRTLMRAALALSTFHPRERNAMTNVSEMEWWITTVFKLYAHSKFKQLFLDVALGVSAGSGVLTFENRRRWSFPQNHSDIHGLEWSWP